MSNANLKAAILVVSTTAVRDPSTDASSGILENLFKTDGGGRWDVSETRVVGDVVLDIQRTLTQWADRADAVNLIITTGGTGFAVHDNTPEVNRLSPEYLARNIHCSFRLSPRYFIAMHQDLYMQCLLPRWL